MRVVGYKTLADDLGKPMLVKEYSRNYPSASSINSPDDLARLLNDLFGLAGQCEEYAYLFACRGHRLVGVFEVSHGGTSTAIVEGRAIFTKALLVAADRIFLAHNHPGGSLIPSNEDIVLTKKIRAAGKMLDIELVDHIIVSIEGHFSLRENVEEIFE